MRWFLLAISATLAAETEMPRGLYRGHLESVEENRILARGADGAVTFCGYDTRTYMEANAERVAPARLRAGDAIVVVADYRGGTRTCYARTLHVIPPEAPPSRRGRPVAERVALARVRGDRTIAGRVVRLNGIEVTVRAAAGDIALALRSDTVYLGEGALAVNRHVSVRAGRNPFGTLDAFQISWAALLRDVP